MHVVSSTNVKGYLILVWIMASILAFSPIISWLGKTPVVTYCDFFTVLQDQYLLVASCILFTLLAFMCFMYGHILYIASKKTRSEETLVLRPRLDSANHRLAPSSKWLKPTKVVLLVVGVNFVTLLPIGIYFMVVLGGHMDHLGYKETGTVVAYVAAPAYLNSLVNPIIYAFKIPYIRATFNRKFTCKTKTGHRVSFNSRRSRRCSSIVTSTL
ncbi:hypothetical protein FSP39_025182 [Pinctada imbricata]|uniref:G-protein coupled receptors family 1 profile domain-containing protein n=1 Tax=Pinctada imbricata TaxID=66713 RepID=A0AA88YGQ8_PINIB|nr:hypothetical protein FSP39_025182 [Pinctada imbricata]